MTEIAYLEYGGYNANEKLYYWDEAGYVMDGGYDDTTAWMASIFTSGQDGNLTHVDFWTTSNNAEDGMYVYDGSFGSQLAYQTNTCAELGYYSMPLTTPVPMTNGQQFTVAVKMTTPGYIYPLPMELKLSEIGYPDICEPPIQSGVCFTRHLDGDPWADAAGFAGVGVNVCLRAKITEPESPVASVSIEPSSQMVAPGGSFNVDVVVDSEAFLVNDGQVNIVTNGRKGDFDDDGDIDIFDFAYFADAYSSETGDPNYNAIGDFDDDGDIDIFDFAYFADVYGT